MPFAHRPPPPLLALLRLLTRSGLAAKLPAVRAEAAGLEAWLRYYGDAVLTGPGTKLRALEGFYQAATAAAARDGKPLLDLFLGDPRFGHFGAQTLAELAGADLGYPSLFGERDLRVCVAELMRERDGLAYDPDEEVLITAGASQALLAAVQCFVNPGDKVVLLDPTYLFYDHALQFQGARVAWVPTAVGGRGLEVDLAALDSALRGARLLFLNSPGNPTGAVIPEATLQTVVDLAVKHDVLIFSDEVYERFVYEGEFVPTARLRGARGRTMTVRSLSKGHGLSGLRVGWVAAESGLIRPLQMHLAVSSTYVAAPSQRLALRALRDPAFGERERAEYRERREIVGKGLAAAGLPAPLPDGSTYFWVPVKGTGLSGQELAQRFFEAERVLLMPGMQCGPSGKDYVRVSLTAPPGELEEAMTRLGRFLRR